MRVAAASLLLAVVAAGAPAHAQSPPSPTPVIVYIGFSTPAGEERPLKAFQTRLRTLGYEDGRNVRIEYRWAEGMPERYPGLVADLPALNPTVVVSQCGPALQAIRNVSRTTAVVVAACIDPAHFQGEIATLARPGGATTGFTFLAPEASGKKLELLRLINPRLTRVAVIHHRDERWEEYWKELRSAATKTGVTLQSYTLSDPKEIDATFAKMARDRMQAAIILVDALTFTSRERLAAVAIRRRMPTISDVRGLALAGVLMSYGPDVAEMHAGAAAYVARILKGERPGDLPVQQPTAFRLVVNAATAAAIGVTLPLTPAERSGRGRAEVA
jgi:putative tryptophan/tyrosine transport system substrate-binding protein